MATSLTRVKGDVKANTIFDLTFDACQKCRKSNFSSRAGTRAKKKKMNDGGGEGEPFFCFRSNFPTITRLETLATQASSLSPRLQHS